MIGIPVGSISYIKPPLQHHDKISVTRYSGLTDHFYILFITIGRGEYDCIPDFNKYSQFDDIEVRSIGINLNKQRGNKNLITYESVLIDKIESEAYNYVVVLDESGSLSSEFYKYLKTKFPTSHRIISYVEPADILLSLDFTKMFLLLKHLDDSLEYNIYYLHNEDNPLNNYYKTKLKSTVTTIKHNVIDVSIKSIQDVRAVLNKIRNSKTDIILSTVDFVFDDVFGKVYDLKDLSYEYNSGNNIVVTISHNNCNAIKSSVTLSWDIQEIVSKIDNAIRDRNRTPSKTIVSSLMSVDMNINNNIFRKYDLKQLEAVLDCADRVSTW